MLVVKMQGICAVLAATFATTAGIGFALAQPASHVLAPERPSLVRPLPGGLAASLSSIIEAELKAKEQALQPATNPFLKPRPRPDREHLAKAAKPGVSATLPERSAL